MNRENFSRTWTPLSKTNLKKLPCIVSTHKKDGEKKQIAKSPLVSFLRHWIDLHHTKSRNLAFIIQPNTLGDETKNGANFQLFSTYSTFFTFNAFLTIDERIGWEWERLRENMLFCYCFRRKTDVIVRILSHFGMNLVASFCLLKTFGAWWCVDMTLEILLIISINQIKYFTFQVSFSHVQKFLFHCILFRSQSSRAKREARFFLENEWIIFLKFGR